MSRLRHEVAATGASGLFDREWYLAEYPDIAGVAPGSRVYARPRVP